MYTTTIPGQLKAEITLLSILKASTQSLHSFSKSGTAIWNSLPVKLRKKYKSVLKKDLKIH